LGLIKNEDCNKIYAETRMISSKSEVKRKVVFWKRKGENCNNYFESNLSAFAGCPSPGKPWLASGGSD
jgi:hypothetical protein